MRRPLCTSCLLVLGLAATGACAGGDAADGGAPGAARPVPASDSGVSSATSPTAAPAADTDASTAESANTSPSPAGVGSASGEDSAPAAAPFRGPCQITWSDGRVLKFKYTDDGGSVSVDHDGDGTRDTCGAFAAPDGRRPTLVRLDEGCDRQTDATLKVTYVEGSTLASATLSRGTETTRVTVVPLPSFGGVLPGYTVPAHGKSLELEETDGRVVAITVKKGAGRPARKVSFSHDPAGRVSSLTEDMGADGSVELQFTYSYDEAGNVTEIRSSAAGRVVTARLDYTCW